MKFLASTVDQEIWHIKILLLLWLVGVPIEFATVVVLGEAVNSISFHSNVLKSKVFLRGQWRQIHQPATAEEYHLHISWR